MVTRQTCGEGTPPPPPLLRHSALRLDCWRCRRPPAWRVPESSCAALACCGRSRGSDRARAPAALGACNGAQRHRRALSATGALRNITIRLYSRYEYAASKVDSSDCEESESQLLPANRRGDGELAPCCAGGQTPRDFPRVLRHGTHSSTVFVTSGR